MNGDSILEALKLPDSSRVDRRVPKKLIIERGLDSASDRRAITECVEQLVWLAALKPETIGVPTYRDDVRDYREIAVLRLTLRNGSKWSPIERIVHRSIPYPVLLITEDSSDRERVSLSAIHKRFSQAEHEVMIIEGDLVSVDWIQNTNLRTEFSSSEDCVPQFVGAIALDRQSPESLLAVYDGFIDVITALKIARVAGRFTIPKSPAESGARRDALQELCSLERTVKQARKAAFRTTQMVRRIELNGNVQKMEARLAAVRAFLNGMGQL